MSAPVIDVYARISRAPDGSMVKVDAQVEDGRLTIRERGGIVGEVFRDNSLSAWNPKIDRPQWNALMERLESGACDGVWVYDLTRFTRKIMEAERLLNVADKGALVWSAFTEYDFRSADGRAAFREAAVRAVAESEKISERTRRGKRRKAMSGRTNATYRGFAMRGYLPNALDWQPGDPRTPISDDELQHERDAVRHVAAMLLDGRTWADMSRWLTDQGFRTAYGHPWRQTSLRTMLQRPSLAGIVVHDGQEVAELTGEPVLDRSTWERVQSAIASRRPGRRPSKRYLLTGLLICSRCGHHLVGRPRTSRKPYADGEIAREYVCLPAPVGVSGCGRIAVDQRFADDVVTEAVLTRLSNPAHAERLSRHAAKIAVERDRIVAEIGRLEDDAAALASKVATWGITRVDAAMGPIDRRLAVLRAQLDALELPQTPILAAAEAADAWAKGDVDARRAMIRRAFPDRITILPSPSTGQRAADPRRFQWGR